ncbi:hypothetical protein [Sphingomonas sp.]|uniref:hypothetical protein n=1 Tax=Sphingomonas sp. TaxID=28214 RepID=UPI003B00A6C3
MAKSDDILAHAEEFMGRIERYMSPEGRAAKKRQRERQRARARLVARRLVLATAAILAVAIMVGAWTPLGMFGFLAMLLAMALAWAAIILWSQPGEATPERIATTALAQLPSQTGEWLDRQRALLPAPAQRQVDQLALSLDAIGPQLAALDPKLPEAIEVRRLIGDELPELVRGYQRVPPSLRRQPLDGGPSPDRQLVDGLTTIEEEVRRMNARLAAGDLKALATQNRFLEIKYRGEDGDRIA